MALKNEKGNLLKDCKPQRLRVGDDRAVGQCKPTNITKGPYTIPGVKSLLMEPH